MSIESKLEVEIEIVLNHSIMIVPATEPTMTDAMMKKGSHVGNEAGAEDGVFVLAAELVVELGPVEREPVEVTETEVVWVIVDEVEGGAKLVPDIMKPLPTVERLVHWDEDGAGCADGVA